MFHTKDGKQLYHSLLKCPQPSSRRRIFCLFIYFKWLLIVASLSPSTRLVLVMRGWLSGLLVGALLDNLELGIYESYN